MSLFTLNKRLFSAVYAAGATSGTPGTALANGKVWVTVQGGTYSTAADYKPCWVDGEKVAGVTRNGDGSISLDAAGESEIWFDGLADIRVESSTGELQYTQDRVSSSGPNVLTGESNLIANGSFEADSDLDDQPDSWTLTPYTGATIAMDDTTGNSSHGTYGLKFTANGSGGGTALSDYFPVSTISKMLRMEWEFKQSTASTGSYIITIFWYKDNAGTASATANTLLQNLTTAAPTTWTKYNAGAAVPSDAVYARLRIEGIGAAGSDKTGTCWYDNIRAYQDNSDYMHSAKLDTTSNSTITFDGIPKWASRINIHLIDVSTNGTNPIYVRFHDSASVLTTNTGSATQVTGVNTTTVASITSTTGIPVLVSANAAGTLRYGRVSIQVVDPGTDQNYVGDAVFGDSGGDTMTAAFKAVATNQYITEVDLNTADVFDAGAFIVSWEA